MIRNYKLGETWNLLEGKFIDFFKVICVSFIASLILSLIFLIPLIGSVLFVFVISPIFMGFVSYLMKHILSSESGLKSKTIQESLNMSLNNFGSLFWSVFIPYLKIFGCSILLGYLFVLGFFGIFIFIDSNPAAILYMLLAPLTLFAWVLASYVVLSKIMISVYGRIISITVGNDKTYQYEKDFRRLNGKKIWWFLIPVVGEYLVQVSMLQSAIDYYHQQGSKVENNL